jgi:UDP-N-acetylmuramoyl-tripeptide--D-alanyl-D-alanine ligase
MRAHTRAQVATFGLGAANSVWADEIHLQGLDGTRFVAHVALAPALGLEASECALTLTALGEQAVLAALPAVALGRMAGLTWEDIQRGLAGQGYGLRLVPVPGLRCSTLLDDSYNASPAATCAALRVLALLPRRGTLAGRRIAVLADMLELGTQEEAGHREVGRCAATQVDLLVTVGPRSRHTADEALRAGLAQEHVHVLDDSESAIALLRDTVAEGDVVLVKGSHSMGMAGVVRALKRPDGEEGAA